MFDMSTVSRNIARLRREQNLTQLELADRLGVSFQSVSNWERGNSMPDISRLPELADVFGVTVDALLGSRQAARMVERVENRGPLSDSEAAGIAPMVKPERLEEKVAASADEQRPMTMEGLVRLAPFLDEDVWLTVADNIPGGYSAGELRGLAPYAGAAIGALLLNAGEVSMSDVASIASYLEEEDFEKLADKMRGQYTVAELSEIASYAGDALGKLVLNAREPRMADVACLAPYLEEEDFDKLADKMRGQYTVAELSEIASYAGDALGKLLQNAREPRMADVACLAPYLEEEDFEKLADKMRGQYTVAELSEIASYAGDALGKLVLNAREPRMADVACLAPYLEEEDFDKLADKMRGQYTVAELSAIASYAGDAMGKLLQNAKEVRLSDVAQIADALEEEQFELLADRLQGRYTLAELAEIAPYAGDALNELLARYQGPIQLESLEKIAPYADSDTLGEMIQHNISRKRE